MHFLWKWLPDSFEFNPCIVHRSVAGTDKWHKCQNKLKSIKIWDLSLSMESRIQIFSTCRLNKVFDSKFWEAYWQVWQTPEKSGWYNNWKLLTKLEIMNNLKIDWIWLIVLKKGENQLTHHRTSVNQRKKSLKYIWYKKINFYAYFPPLLNSLKTCWI